MMIRSSLATGAVLLALCGHASAADNAALKKCMDSANTTLDMVTCNTKAAKVQDERLNRAYKTALAAQEGPRKNKRNQRQAPLAHGWRSLVLRPSCCADFVSFV